METPRHYASVIGRFLLSLIFIMSGMGKLFDWSGTAAYMQSEGMVAIPFFLTMAILFEVLGGLSILLGFKARWGALALIVFLIPTTLIFHDFWTYDDPQMRQLQMINFMKNLAIMGGLFLVFSLGPGSLSLDAQRGGAGGA